MNSSISSRKIATFEWNLSSMAGPVSNTWRSSVTNQARAAGSLAVADRFENYESAVDRKKALTGVMKKEPYQIVQLGQDLCFDHVEFTIQDVLGIDHREQDLDRTAASLVMTRHAQSEHPAC